MIITMSGKAGSGKGTVAKILAEKLGYEHISIG
jgi:cytidylate kinase